MRSAAGTKCITVRECLSGTSLHMRQSLGGSCFPFRDASVIAGQKTPTAEMIELHRHLLLKHRNELSSDLLVDDVLAFLQGKFILNLQDTEIIRSERTSKLQAEKLLDILPTKGYEAFHQFYDVLIEKYPHLAELLKSGVNEERYGALLDGVDSPRQCKLRALTCIF